MGNGVQPISPSGPRAMGPTGAENIDETGKVGESGPKQGSGETQPSDRGNVRPSVSNPSARKLEQSLNGTARRAELEGHLDHDIERGESMRTARRILDDPKLSNEAKVTELQKMISKTNGQEFREFMKQLDHFSLSERQMVNSAISESPNIMERAATDLRPWEQLAVVSDAILHPLHRKSESEERKRLERTDKGFAGWIQRTDAGTLDAALEGKAVDFRASAKLFGVLTSDPAGLIMNMGHHQSRIIGDNLIIATDLMNLVHGPASRTHGPLTRAEIEDAAGGLIIRHAQASVDKRQGSLSGGK